MTAQQKTDSASNCLKDISDESLFEEAAHRLQAIYVRANKGRKLLFGFFKWVFHDGRFLAIEECSRNRSYVSLYSRGSGAI